MAFRPTSFQGRPWLVSENRICTQESSDSFGQQFRFGGFAFPNRENIPPCRPEFLHVFLVPLLIVSQFRTPVLGSGFGNVGLWATAVLMPKTALNLNNFQQPWKN